MILLWERMYDAKAHANSPAVCLVRKTEGEITSEVMRIGERANLRLVLMYFVGIVNTPNTLEVNVPVTRKR